MFIPGLQISSRLYEEVVQPILESHIPSRRYDAALIGPGSDVLGFDSPISTDHGWGPRLLVLLEDDNSSLTDVVCAALRQDLPSAVLGYPMGRVVCVDAISVEPVIAVGTLRQFVKTCLGCNLDRPFTAADWLSFPSQKLRELTAGAVFYDGVGELTALRERLSYYPMDVWLYLLASGWQRIGQEEHLMPRAGFVGDELGSALIGARLVRDIMSLCFLMERQYAPYPKWFGTAFVRLSSAIDLIPKLRRAQLAESWQEREAALCEAYERVASMHNSLGITEPLQSRVFRFYDRPFKMIGGERFAKALCERIKDPEVARIASRRLVGSIDQFSDSTDLREWPGWRRAVRTFYEESE